MQVIELLTVEDTFQLSGIGLTCTPDFAVPPGNWKNFTCQSLVVRPDGIELRTTAHFNAWHFNLIDRTAPPDKRYRVVLTFPDVLKKDLPVGSKVFVPQSSADIIRGGAA